MQVDPVIIEAGLFGSGSDALINFTLVPYNTPQCTSNNIGECMRTCNQSSVIVLHSQIENVMTLYYVSTGSTLQSLITTKNAASASVMLSFELLLLSMAILLVNSGQI
jgi:hypothetical protein